MIGLGTLPVKVREQEVGILHNVVACLLQHKLNPGSLALKLFVHFVQKIAKRLAGRCCRRVAMAARLVPVDLTSGLLQHAEKAALQSISAFNHFQSKSEQCAKQVWLIGFSFFRIIVRLVYYFCTRSLLFWLPPQRSGQHTAGKLQLSLELVEQGGFCTVCCFLKNLASLNSTSQIVISSIYLGLDVKELNIVHNYSKDQRKWLSALLVFKGTTKLRYTKLHRGAGWDGIYANITLRVSLGRLAWHL